MASTAGSNGSDAGGYAEPEPTTDHETYALPLDGYAASDAQWRTLQRAQFVLTRRCAGSVGLTLPPVDVPSPNPAAAFLSDHANDVRPLTIRQARRLGYGVYPTADPAENKVIERLSAAQRAVYNRCDAESTRTLLRGVTQAKVPGQSTMDSHGRWHALRDDDTYVHNVYVNEARARSITPAVRHAWARWSSCMAGHGYPGLTTTVDPIQAQADPPSAADKRQAVQDVRCKESTGFMTVWVAALRDAQQEVVDAHRSALAGFEKRLQTRMANAAQVLR